MQTIRLKKKRDCGHLIGKEPSDSEYDAVIDPPARIVRNNGGLTDSVLGVYLKLPPKALKIMGHIARYAKTTKGLRTYGLPMNSAIFGALPRIEIRQNYCRLTRNSVEQRDLMALVLDFAGDIAKLYEKHLPGEYGRHLKMSVQDVLTEWLLPDTPFSTVNFNLNHAIRYHRDRANQKGVMSNVIITRQNVEGGLLVLPEYQVALRQGDGALIIFDGQAVVHGVTPIQFGENGYRCSVVFYTLRGMKNCYPYAEEFERAKVDRTRIEDEYRTELSRESIRKSVKLMDSAIVKRGKREKA